MSNKDKYDQVFIESFGVEKKDLGDEFVYQCVPEWDSVGHMSMIASIEDAFEISLETDDIIDFGSYTKGIVILAKYGVEI